MPIDANADSAADFRVVPVFKGSLAFNGLNCVLGYAWSSEEESSV